MAQKNEIVLPPPIEEPIIATTVEKQRLNKNRNVAKQDTEPTLSNRYGPHYIKTTFLIDRSNVGNQPSNEELHLCKVYHEQAQLYSSVDWQINNNAITACSMTAAEKKNANTRKNVTAPTEHTCYEPSKPMASRDVNVEMDHVQIRRRKKVLVPISGGISSLATLWWCLLQDFDIYLCYAFDALSRNQNSVENPFEIQCLLRLLQYARRKDGTLLFETVEKPGGVHELTRAEIQQRIRVVQVPLSCYCLPELQKVPQVMSTEASLKAHPQAYLLFYRQMIIVAQSLSCSAIALGIHGHGKTLLQSANPAWSTIHKHELLFPFETRERVLESFQDAAEQSWSVWKSYLQLDKEGKEGIWQTAGPSLMPNAPHYVTTCQTRPPKALEEQMLEAQERALGHVQQLLEVDSQREQDAIDDAVARGEKMRKKRAVDPFQHAQYLEFFLKELENVAETDDQAFNFCNQENCNDCCVWHTVTRNWHLKSDALRSKWQNLASEYCCRLRGTLDKKKQQTNNVIAKNLPKKRELTLADVIGKPAKKPRIDEDEDVDDKVEEEDDEDIEEADFEDEDEEEAVAGGEDDEEEAVILAEDEEVEGEGEGEEEDDAPEEEKEKDEDEDEDDLDLDEEEEDEDEEEDDDDDDAGDEDY